MNRGPDQTIYRAVKHRLQRNSSHSLRVRHILLKQHRDQREHHHNTLEHGINQR
ncbi:hypothetical protein C7S15_3576 [Burkholderia cepacia]|nr:hypothetical protein [Burkholderia cepacia]